MRHFILEKIKKRPLLLLLLLILTLITVTNIKPEYWFIGWDNYSSYFNLKTNIFRTFFATWREYRGLGVASDAEVTDIFRQIFFLITSPFLSEKLLDQTYYLIALNMGTIGMYMFADTIVDYYGQQTSLHKHKDSFSFLAAFFYLFNLNTLAVFHFPIVMFATRYFALPLIFFTLLKLIYEQHISKKQYIAYVALLLLTSGSYMVPTVFITTAITLMLFFPLQKPFKRAIVVSILFIGINMFWLLPFANYSIEKSSIVRRAPTFVEDNEAFTNKPSSYLSAQRQLIFYPQFFDMSFRDSRTKKTLFFHPLAQNFSLYPNSFALLYLFPILYLLGTGFILFFKQKRQWLWLPATTLLFLFLSTKEQSPLGFLYVFLTKVSPYFEIIFRFGDTKFHPYIAFSGSIMAAISCVSIYNWLQKKISSRILIFIFFLLMFVPNTYLFQEYFKGKLIGFFMYNRIPSAYQQLVKDINNDPEHFRVMHFPIDKASYYWKPYSWGIFGSSFLNFMLDKPFFDKTFQPASMENAYTDEKVNALITDFQSLNKEPEIKKRADDFYRLLQKLNVKYLIFDETVTPRSYVRGIDYWGVVDNENERKMIQSLLKYRLIEKAKKYEVDLNEYQKTYERFYPYTKAYLDELKGSTKIPITLYKINNPDKKIFFVEQIEKIELELPTLMLSNIYPPNYRTIQGDTTNASLYPFQHQNNTISFDNGNVYIRTPSVPIEKGEYTVSIPQQPTAPQQTRLIDVYISVDKNSLIVSLYYRYLPSIQNNIFTQKIKEFTIPLSNIETNTTATQSTQNMLNNWFILPGPVLNNLRLRIDNTVVPLPLLTTKQTHAGSLIVHHDNFIIELLGKQNEEGVDLSTLNTIENSDCYKDALKDYKYTLQKSSNSLFIDSQNGSVCIYKNIKEFIDSTTAHLELQFDIEGRSKNLDTKYNYQNGHISSKPILKKIINELQKPSHLKLCIKEQSRDECYNSHDVNVADKQHIVVPFEKNANAINEPQLFIALRNETYQQQKAQITNMHVDRFELIAQDEVDMTELVLPPTKQLLLDPNKQLEISFPLPINASSYYLHRGVDSFYYHNTPCENAYRTIRLRNDDIVSYVEQCESTFFAQLPFSSNNFYIWQIDYNLASGQYPYFILDDKYKSYIRERISLNQGYPNIDGFKLFQKPEYIANEKNIRAKFNNLKKQQAYAYAYPHSEYQDNRPKNFYLKQSTENEGLFTLADFNVIELPNFWSQLILKHAQSDVKYALPDSYTFKQILPSLWEVDIRLSANQTYLLFFNEGYDHQWGAYKTITDLFLGSTAGPHYKCDGYANCFEFSKTDLENTNTTLYLFYFPEMFSLVGWGITLLSIGIFTVFFAKKFR